jgi:hypothetical protein
LKCKMVNPFLTRSGPVPGMAQWNRFSTMFNGFCPD